MPKAAHQSQKHSLKQTKNSHQVVTNNGNTARTFKKKPGSDSKHFGHCQKHYLSFAELLDMFNDPVNKPCSKVLETKARQLFGLLCLSSFGMIPDGTECSQVPVSWICLY
jgi:hypothetical protein